MQGKKSLKGSSQKGGGAVDVSDVFSTSQTAVAIGINGTFDI